MPQLVKSSSIVIAVILLWAAPSAFLGRAFNIVQPCAFLGVILCLLLLLPISRNENTWRKLTFQPYTERQQVEEGGEPVDVLLGVLIAGPVTILFTGWFYWLLSPWLF